jgi:hypothetical protein
MPIQFPPSPSVNQEYTYEGKVWAWDGSSWVGVRQETGIQKSNIWAKQNLLIPKRGFGLNSGYNGTTDQRRTAAGTIPSLKHYIERDLGLFENNPIVTSGLLLNLDAGNAASYPGTGTIWTDLSGNARHGTLTNGVGYNSGNGGYLIFDNVNDYVTVSSIGVSTFTYQGWVYSTPSNDGYGYFYSAGSFGFAISEGGDLGFVGGTVPGDFYYYNSSSPVDLNCVLPQNVWVNVASVIDGSSKVLQLYINGILQSTTNVTTTQTDITEFGRFTTGANYFNGRKSNITIYNRALSQSEITQNYNALKGRYGL